MKILKLFGLMTKTEANELVEDTYYKTKTYLNEQFNIERKHYQAIIDESVPKCDYNNFEKMHKIEIQRLEKKISTLRNSNEELGRKLGGLTKSNHNLRESNEILIKQVNELNSSAFLRKKVPSGRTPNTNNQKIVSSSRKSELARIYGGCYEK